MHHSDDKMMTKKNNIFLMKCLEIHHIEFAPFLEKNVTTTCDNSEIRLLTCFIHMNMNVVAVNVTLKDDK